MVKGILKFRVPCHPVEAVPIVLERGTVILARHTNQHNMLPTDDFLRSLLFSPYWEQKKCRKICKTLPKHKTKLKKIEIGRITILNGSTSIQYGQESITSHNLSTTFNTCVNAIFLMPEKMTRNVFRKKKFYPPTPHSSSNIGGNKIPNENKVVANFLPCQPALPY